MIDAVARASRVYFDTAPLIYFIEDNRGFADLVSPVIESVEAGDKQGLSSYVTLIEVLVQPLRFDRRDLAERYRDGLLRYSALRLCEVGHEVAEEAARIRARYGFDMPDAIHLATARVYGAEVFLTNDRNLRGFGELAVVVLGDHAQAG